MKKSLPFRFSFLLLLLLIPHLAAAQSLRFRADSTFHIVQFTDTHIDISRGSNLQVYATVRDILAAEHPDLVVLTGDIITEDKPFEGYRRFSDLFAAAGVPWVVVFGNHDSEGSTPRHDIAAFLTTLPGCLNRDDPATPGACDFVLPVSDRRGHTAALLYFFDSNAYSPLDYVGGYDWIHFPQIAWYRARSRAFTEAHGGIPLPALAFFHIPLPEYEQAWHNKDRRPVGKKKESISAPCVNSGMFVSMLEMGDVMATFVGHDHLNDFIGCLDGVALAYGRVTKVMPRRHDPTAGGRVIVLREDARRFTTWIRDLHGKKTLVCTYPDSFL